MTTMPQPQPTEAPGEDQPVVVGGASQHMTITVRDSCFGYEPQTFSITPKDPAVPFKEVVITDGAREVFRWQLSEDWKVTVG
jgi:hypothetical protein